jgi:hypothetical protein
MKSDFRNIDADFFRRHFDYDESSGIFRRRTFRGKQLSDTRNTGTFDARGYITLSIEGQNFLAHRVAWAIKNGDISSTIDIDHINGNKSDNRLKNLRIASRSENSCNKPISKQTSSGVKGVCWHKLAGKWYAQLKIKGAYVYRKSFDRLEDAERAIKEKRTEFHGEFANHGKAKS